MSIRITFTLPHERDPLTEIITRTIPEMQIGGVPRLGRHVKHDPQSRKFSAEAATTIVNTKHESFGLPLKQTVRSCTAEALIGARNSSPNMTDGKHIYGQADAMALYALETKNEGQPYPPNDPGGTGLDVCKAAVQMGLITGYDHAFGLNHALLALVVRPVITGVDWFDSFDRPDKNGLVTIAKGATVRGGHEIVVLEIDTDRRLVGCENSWGPDYGKNGRFYMSWMTWATLLRRQGDVTVPVV